MASHTFAHADNIVEKNRYKMATFRVLLYPIYQENVSIVPIIGMEGLGKTELAQFVFHDEEVAQNNFQ